MSQSVAADFATTLVDQLAAGGLRYCVVCPGSRSAPLAMAIARHPAIRTFVHVDERSGSFFAVGLAKQLEEPVGLVCTSGTAAAEFHPAVVEAFHSFTPLLVLTADRPPELHDVGAPQTITQVGLYGSAVRWSHDPGVPDKGAALTWRRLATRALAETFGPPAGPVHLNLPFREPLVNPAGVESEAASGTTSSRSTAVPQALGDEVTLVAAALNAARRPIIVAGEMRQGRGLAPLLDRVAAA
ncbi:MAG: 2-succinyl-5-enolpyruvyl-6-hydroxy-3-cyclohexene-1-carboxylic-acid synthase, partial [Candidatus Dormibacteria bacterium]